jgi:hypothetical protein
MVGRVIVVVLLLVVAGWIFYTMIYPYLKQTENENVGSSKQLPQDRTQTEAVSPWKYNLREGPHNKWTHRTMTKGVFRPSDSRLPQA